MRDKGYQINVYKGRIGKKGEYDEFYTTKKEVEYIIRDFIGYNYFNGKKIYCPCDSDESEFTKYFKEHKDELEYADFINTCDDMFTHEDLFYWADIVITNEPFSLKRKMFKLLKKVKESKELDYLLFCTPCITRLNMLCDDFKIYRAPRDMNVFITKDRMDKTGDYYIEIPHVYITNIEGVKYNRKKVYNKILKDIDPVYFKTCDGKYSGIVIDRFTDCPMDYDGYLAVPLTVFIEDNRYLFDIYNLSYIDMKCSDGKSRFCRYLVKLKSPIV